MSSLTGRGSSSTRGSANGFDNGRHPRDFHGRFAHTGSSKRPTVSGADARTIAKVAGRLRTISNETKELRSEHRSVLADLGREQKARLLALTARYGVYGNRTPKLPTVPSKPVKKSTKRIKNRVEFDSTGATAHLEPHHPSFSVLTDPKHQFNVRHTPTGNNLVLNEHKTQMNFIGEKVQGVPPPLLKPKKASNAEVLEALAKSVYGAGKKNAPKYDEKGYGIPNVDPSLVARAGYGTLQIHHINQWVKDPARDIEDDFAAGKITEAQRQHRHYSQIEPRPNPGTKESPWQLKLAPQGERAFVVLPGGIHDFTATKIYHDVHPKFLHPTTGKLEHMSIPTDGDGRNYFDRKFRNPFWKQYHLHHANELTKEVNRRIKAGKLDANEAKKKYETYLKTITYRLTYYVSHTI